ncbi:YrdC domain-containing protein, mitochondrial [Lamellibrachia satsuma]|nr:YrdC domain-containing protein, mitochondrial [Lamellibrachia satsuma]
MQCLKLQLRKSTPNGCVNEWTKLVTVACDSLRGNNVIAVPTDTIYGIAGLAQSSDAVRKIYNIKGRHLAKPISICVSCVADVAKWGRVTVSSQLLSELLPGPVTVVFERTLNLNPDLNPGTSLVGIRVPNHGFVQEICEKCAEPLALTSANISSEPSALAVKEFEALWPKLHTVFDGGKLGGTAESRKGSTVVDLSKPGLFTVIREGSAFHQTTIVLEKYGLKEEKKQ